MCIIGAGLVTIVIFISCKDNIFVLEYMQLLKYLRIDKAPITIGDNGIAVDRLWRDDYVGEQR